MNNYVRENKVREVNVHPFKCHVYYRTSLKCHSNVMYYRTSSKCHASPPNILMCIHLNFPMSVLSLNFHLSVCPFIRSSCAMLLALSSPVLPLVPMNVYQKAEFEEALGILDVVMVTSYFAEEMRRCYTRD